MLNHKLTVTEFEANRLRIIELLRSVDRDKIEILISELDRSGFFTEQPLSSRHHKWVGGLAQHSLGTYDEARRLVCSRGVTSIPESSLIVACLLHDLCKAHGLYPEIHREHPHEHGRRSIRKLDKMGFALTRDERNAICNHMHHDPHSATSLWAVVHAADGIDARKG